MEFHDEFSQKQAEFQRKLAIKIKKREEKRKKKEIEKKAQMDALIESQKQKRQELVKQTIKMKPVFHSTAQKSLDWAKKRRDITDSLYVDPPSIAMLKKAKQRKKGFVPDKSVSSKPVVEEREEESVVEEQEPVHEENVIEKGEEENVVETKDSVSDAESAAE
ncbi:hypothetical protein GEMRC1_012603 [Eukaryota sp. GEM-RC1]